MPSCAARAGGGCSRRPSAARSCRSCRTSSPRVSRRVREVERRRRAPRASTRIRRRKGDVVAARRAVVDQHELHAGPDLRVDRLQQRQELGVDEDHVVLGVIDRVEHLLGRDPDVHRVQHRTHHRHGEEAFEVAVAVPVHDRDRRTRADAERDERGREAVHALAERGIRVAQPIGVDDLLCARGGEAVGEDLADRKRRVACRRRADDREVVHECLLRSKRWRTSACVRTPRRLGVPRGMRRRCAPIARAA